MSERERRELEGYEFVLQSGQPIFAGNMLRNKDVLTKECILRLWKPIRMDFKRSM